MSLARRAAEPGGHSTLRRRPSKAKRPVLPQRRQDPVTSRVYGLVMNRDGGCVLRTVSPCGGRTHWHHRKQVKHGGPSIASNGATLCDLHHKRVHDAHPETAGRGLLLTRYDDPWNVAVVLHDGRTVLLNDDGTITEVD